MVVLSNLSCEWLGRVWYTPIQLILSAYNQYFGAEVCHVRRVHASYGLRMKMIGPVLIAPPHLSHVWGSDAHCMVVHGIFGVLDSLACLASVFTEGPTGADLVNAISAVLSSASVASYRSTLQSFRQRRLP